MKSLKTKLFLYIGLFLALSIVVSGCYYDNVEELYSGSADCDVENVDYVTVIKPIIDTNCAISGCHVPGTGEPDFTTYTGVKKAVDNGSIEDRVIVRKDMPPAGPLSSCNIAKIQAWIDKGAPAN